MNKTRSVNSPAEAVKHKLLPESGARCKPSARPVGTIFVDPHGLFREGLERLLAETPFRVTASAGRIDSIVLGRCIAPPRLVLIGGHGDSRVTASEIQRAGEIYPQSKRVLMSSFESAEEIEMALHAGVEACLSKTTTAEMLIATLKLVMMGEAVFSSSLLSVVRGAASSIASKPVLVHQEVGGTNCGHSRNNFSKREVETLECLVRGESNKLIARTFDIAEATVKVHIKAILRKIRVANRTQAAIWAVTNLVASAPAANSPPERLSLSTWDSQCNEPAPH
jgi:two-component system, NarL family, nitrate/nitrite response regulator NarL